MLWIACCVIFAKLYSFLQKKQILNMFLRKIFMYLILDSSYDVKQIIFNSFLNSVQNPVDSKMFSHATLKLWFFFFLTWGGIFNVDLCSGGIYKNFPYK